MGKLPIKIPRQQEFLLLMLELAKLFKPQVYVEVGVKKGYTFKEMSKVVGQAIGVDIEPPTYTPLDNMIVHTMTSEAFAESLRKTYVDTPFIDMLFIDADHRYKAVARDFDNLSPFVVPTTGLILMHDTCPVHECLMVDGYCSDAWKFAVDLRTKRKYKDFEVVTLPGPYFGLTIVRKVGEDDPCRRG